MTKAERIQTYQVIKAIGDKHFGGRCGVTLKECVIGLGFVVHHKKYLPGEKDHEDFKTPGAQKMTDSQRLQYYLYLQQLIATVPERELNIRFGFITTNIHQQVSRLRRYKDNDTIARLAEMAIESEYVGKKRSTKITTN